MPSPPKGALWRTRHDELRTPLTALGGYADVLLMGAATVPRDLALALETMRGEAHRMTRLVNSLLILARLDAGQLVPLGAVELGALLRETAASLSLLHPDRRVGCTIEAEPMVVRGDPDCLRQVVANLADNALAFTDARGGIDLALRAEAGMARITVADDGIGIAPRICHMCAIGSIAPRRPAIAHPGGPGLAWRSWRRSLSPTVAPWRSGARPGAGPR